MKAIIKYGYTRLTLRHFSVKILLHTVPPTFLKNVILKFTGSQSGTSSVHINLSKTKRNLLYIRNHSVPRSKHFPLRSKHFPARL